MGLLNRFRKQNTRSHYKDEVVEHLTDLLNTKREFGSWPKDYGLDSYIYLGSNNKVVLQIISDISTCLEKYEKRLQQVEIVHVPTENSFVRSFIIKCKIENNPCSFHLFFDSTNKKNPYSLEVKE